MTQINASEAARFLLRNNWLTRFKWCLAQRESDLDWNALVERVQAAPCETNEAAEERDALASLIEALGRNGVVAALGDVDPQLSRGPLFELLQTNSISDSSDLALRD